MPTVIADRCVPVASSWVYQFILTCDGELAVQFKQHVRTYRGRRYGGVPGVTCLYPGTDQRLFDVAILHPSPGRFVHRFLYRRRPYQLIQCPCPAAGCGPGGYGPLLWATANHPALPGSISLEWDGSLWYGQFVPPYGSLELRLSLAGGQFTLELAGCATATLSPVTFVPTPLYLEFGPVDISVCAGGPATASFFITE